MEPEGDEDAAGKKTATKMKKWKSTTKKDKLETNSIQGEDYFIQ